MQMLFFFIFLHIQEPMVFCIFCIFFFAFFCICFAFSFLLMSHNPWTNLCRVVLQMMLLLMLTIP